MRFFYSLIIILFSSIFYSPPLEAQEFIEYYNSKSKTAVVFIHGFRGDENSFARWPSQVRSDESLGEPSTYLFNYPASISDRLTITEVAGQLALLLQDAQNSRGAKIFDQYTSFVFVTHSMGGLVLRKTLVDHPGIRNRTKAALFLAGPFLGSDLANTPIANIVDFVTATESIKLLSSAPDNKFLNDLNADWETIRDNIPSYCSYEKLPSILPKWFGFFDEERIIVSKESALEGCDVSKAVNTSHMDIAQIAEDKHSITRALLQKLYAEKHIANLIEARKRIIAIDSFRYGEIGEADKENDTNYYEIKEVLEESEDFQDADIIKLPSAQIGWDASVVKYFDPSVIVMHWSTFEAGEDCYVNGGNFDAASCQRLVKNTNDLLENSKANILLYTRTPNACRDVPSFFKSAIEIINEDKMERIRILDLPLASIDRPTGQRYLENDGVKISIRRAVTSAAHGLNSDAKDIAGLCKVY